MKILLLIVSLLLIGVLYVQQIEPVIIEKPVIRIVQKPIIVEIEKVVEVPRWTNTIIIVKPNATDEELTRVFRDIEYGKFSHRFYLDNPVLQTPQTGDTETNIYWLETYELLQDLLERAYGR